MPEQAEGPQGSGRNYVRYTTKTYTTMPDALVAAMARRRVGRNGWAVMACLCKGTFEDGTLAQRSAERLSQECGLNLNQIARGMKELRDKEIIAPVVRRGRYGRKYVDRSNYGHVAQWIGNPYLDIIVRDFSLNSTGLM